MTPTIPEQDRLAAACTKWFDTWTGLSVSELAARANEPPMIPNELPALLLGSRASLLPVLEAVENGKLALPSLAFARIRSWLQARNPYLPASDTRLEPLLRPHFAEIARELAHAQSETQVRQALETTERALLAKLVALVQAGATSDQRELVCAQYAADTQLRVLALQASRCLEPVLDLGCGQQANLVRSLRQAGLEATGTDVSALAADGVRAQDWFEFDLRPSTWGTIVSHLGFSIHFLHYHLKPGTEALKYAQRYMDILRALRPGGTFAYAPGLPFVEEHLPGSRYEVQRYEIEGLPRHSALDDQLRAAMDKHPFYACHVRRLV